MRNVDKIKSLEHELERYRKKVGDQQKELDELKALKELSDKGTKELNRAVDSIMTEVLVKFGESVEEGVLELSLPLVSVYRNTRDYMVMARVSDDNDSYILRAVRREAEKTEAEDGEA